MKLMLWRTIKTARLHSPGGMKNHGWRVPVGFPQPHDYEDWGKPTGDTQLRLWKAAGECKCLHRCNFGLSDFSC